ncbi:unnamed protein product [Orchesella dallaii]|uniref:Uncharacterized protein n=1 Tax=Orchesella dallaii TaxID=48710 RepID=A0ABP1Q0D0_9HEXA
MDVTFWEATLCHSDYDDFEWCGERILEVFQSSLHPHQRSSSEGEIRGPSCSQEHPVEDNYLVVGVTKPSECTSVCWERERTKRRGREFINGLPSYKQNVIQYYSLNRKNYI